jgi:hypothetical protein
MGKILLDSGDALQEGQSTTVQIPANLKIRSLVVSLIGSSSGSQLPVDDIADLTLKRQLPGKASKKGVQEASLSLCHRMAQYPRIGDVLFTNVGGGDIDIEGVLDQFVPTRPDNVLHTMGTDEATLEIDWGSLGNASSLTYEVHAKTDKSAVEQYLRRFGVADLQMNSGVNKTRDTDKNVHRLWLYNPNSVIADNTIDVSEWVADQEDEHFADQGYDDLERSNQKALDVDDSGVMDQFTRLPIAQGRRRSEHINDRVHYEIEGSGSGAVYVVHDRVDFENAYNERSARALSSRQQGRLARDPRPAAAGDVERAMLRQ